MGEGLFAPQLDDSSTMCHVGTTLAPCAHQGRKSRQNKGTETYTLSAAREEKLDNTVREPSTHKREGKPTAWPRSANNGSSSHGLERAHLRQNEISGGKLALYWDGSQGRQAHCLGAKVMQTPLRFASRSTNTVDYSKDLQTRYRKVTPSPQLY